MKTLAKKVRSIPYLGAACSEKESSVPLKRANGRFPDFILIGAARSGTTTLYRHLCKHPRIFMSKDKEPEYFSCDSVYSRGAEWYRTLFAEARADQLAGEASTTYTRWPHTLDAPRLIAETIPDIKMIYIMRHPVERAYSHYKRHILREQIATTFEEALAGDSIYVDCSMYIRQIERYLQYFPRERFLFLFASQLESESQMLLREIERFLGIEEMDHTSDAGLRANAADSDYYIREKTTGKVRKMPPFDLLARILPKGVKDVLYRTLIKNSFIGRRLESRLDLPRLPAETRERLIEVFEKPNKELERLLGIQLDRWRH